MIRKRVFLMRKRRTWLYLAFVLVSLSVGVYLAQHVMSPQKKGVLIVVALEKELDPAVVPPEFDVIYTGIGKLNAAIATLQGIQKYHPKLVVNFGTVGDVKGALNGVLEVSQVIQRDMNPSFPTPRGTTPYFEYEAILSSGHQGVRCGTGDTFVEHADAWIKKHADVVDMELYAIALVCARLGVPWRSFKFVTDKANIHAEEDWEKHIKNGQARFLAALSTLSP